MPLLGKRADGFSLHQCTAHRKRSGVRCKSYACRGKQVCRMHGGTSKRGAQHWNYRTGLHSKDVKEAGAMMGRFLERPVAIKVQLFARPLEEIAAKVGRGQRLDGLVVSSEQMTVGERMRALRAARRLIGQELAELRAEVDGLTSHSEAANGP